MRSIFFFLGLLILIGCIALPLPSLDAGYPFSAHMLRHSSILLLAAPLLALAISPENRFRKSLTRLSALTNRFPLLAWLTGVGLMWFWHVPPIYNAMSDSHAILCGPIQASFLSVSTGANLFGPAVFTLLHNISLLAGGFLFCWPIITPYTSFRLTPLSSVLYLSSACVFCSLLGLLITFAPADTYWHINPVDRQTGGLIMWVPCCFIYLSASLYLLIRWLSANETSPIPQI